MSKPRRRPRRSKDKRGPAKLTPRRAQLAAKRRHESCLSDELFNQA